MLLRLLHTLLAPVLLALSGTVLSEPLRLGLVRDQIALAGHIEQLEDPNGHMSLSDVMASDHWHPLTGMPNAGFTRSVIWLRVELDRPHDIPEEWRLESEMVQVDDLRLYLRDAKGNWQEQRAGRAMRHEEWPLESRVPTFRLQLPPGVQTVYLRMSGYHTLSGALRLWTPEGFRVHGNREALALGGYFGVFIVVVVLQFFFWLFGRESFSGWYLVYTLVLLTGTLLNSGYPQNYFNLTSDITVNVLGLYLCLAPLAVIRLTVHWLQLRSQLPRAGQIFEVTAYSMGLVTSVLALFHSYEVGVGLAQALSLVWTVVCTTMGVLLWRRKAPDAGAYVVIFSFVNLGILTRFARNLGWLPVDFWTDYSLYIGVTLHLLAMSLYFVQRYNALQSALDLEQRAREEQRDFVALVSHEFRTPLAIISTTSQQLAKNPDAPPEKSRQRIVNIRSAVQRMSLLLDDYLSLDRIDTAQQALQLRSCDPYEIIESAVSDFPPGRVRMTLHELPQSFVCDPDLIRIVLRNLLANADRHSASDTVIDLEATGDRKSMTLRVIDIGEGIPEDELPRVFQRYFRGRASQGKPGAGLGLHLVQRVVQAHGGSITVESRSGKGSTFTVTLPNRTS